MFELIQFLGSLRNFIAGILEKFFLLELICCMNASTENLIIVELEYQRQAIMVPNGDY